MMHKISVLTAVYQGERFIQRHIDQVLNFDYKNIEFIIVNDGSTDKTHEIIVQNEERIKAAGYEFKYIQMNQNSGAAAATQAGLEVVTGDYLSWMDVDDIFYPNCLSRCLEVCKNNPECKVVYSKAEVAHESDLNKVISIIPAKEFVHDNLFLDYILENNVIFAPLRFVETKALFDALNNKPLCISPIGQNWQIFLPIVYKYKWKYIDDILAKYVIYGNSVSHNLHPKLGYTPFEKTLLDTLNNINMPEKEKRFYKKIVKKKYDKLRKKYIFRLSISLRKRKISITLFGKTKTFFWGENDTEK